MKKQMKIGFVLLAFLMSFAFVTSASLTSITPTDRQNSATYCTKNDTNFVVTLGGFAPDVNVRVKINGIDLNNNTANSWGIVTLDSNATYTGWATDGNLETSNSGTIAIQLKPKGAMTAGKVMDLNVYATRSPYVPLDGNNVYVSNIYVIPPITYTAWNISATGASTACLITNFASISGLTLADPNGRLTILLNDTIDLNSIQNIDGNVALSSDLKVSSTLPAFSSKSATLTFNKVGQDPTQVYILRNGVVCYDGTGATIATAPLCTSVSTSGNQGIKFTIATFSTYEVVPTTPSGGGIPLVVKNGQLFIQQSDGSLIPYTTVLESQRTGQPIIKNNNALFIIAGIVVVLIILVLVLAGSGKKRR